VKHLRTYESFGLTSNLRSPQRSFRQINVSPRNRFPEPVSLKRTIDGEEVMVEYSYLFNNENLANRILDLVEQYGTIDSEGDLEIEIPISGSEDLGLF